MARPKIVPINVSSRVLRHIGRGIYRTPAGALKELVSNAYDAGAREVTVTTGWPVLQRIVVTDNGKGMTEEEFVDVIQHIGFSNKNTGDEVIIPGTRVKRRAIGHFGIGLLAVGQLAGMMTITSKTEGTRTGFTAEIDFDQFDHVTEDDIERAEIKLEAGVEHEEASQRDAESPALRIEKCKVTRDEYPAADKDESFTRIVLNGIRRFVHEHLAGQLAESNTDAVKHQRYSSNFQELLRLLREREATVSLGWYPYERLVWEMSVYCPVAYPNIGPFAADGTLHHIAAVAAKARFALKIDGIMVLKPFERAFFEDSDFPVEEIFSWENEPFASGETKLQSSGYLIYKRRIRPKAIQGVLVRDDGVAVGLYDTTYLRYPFNEGQKFNQLTGEIYATGLSGALNIDRNSFNETDDTYLSLCKWFHKKLREEGVFTRLKQLQSSPEASRRSENRAIVQETLALIADKLGGTLQKVRFEKLGRSAPLLSVHGKTLVLNQDHPDGSGSGAKREKVLLAAVLVLGGVLTPAEIQDFDALIYDAKRQMRAEK
jgi:hypothetical protein